MKGEKAEETGLGVSDEQAASAQQGFERDLLSSGKEQN